MNADDSALSGIALEMRDWLAEYVCSVLDVGRETYPFDATFDTLGLDSVEAVILAGMMEERFNVQVDPSHLYDHPTTNSFAAFVASQVGAPKD